MPESIDYYGLIQDKLISEKKTVYILKGFGDLDFEDYKLERLYRLDIKDIIKGEIDYKKLSIYVFSKLMTENSFVLSYEEFACCKDKLMNYFENNEYNLVIINNNIFHSYYPIPKSFDNPEVKELISKDKDNLVNSIFDEFIIVKKQVFVEYTGFDDNANITVEDLFKTRTVDLKPVDDDDSKTYTFGMTEETYLDFLLSIKENDEKNINILLDSNDFLPYQKNLLSILHYFDITYRIVKRTVKKIEDFRANDYLKILKRKNSSYEFRNIEFYKNPGFSLETINISQCDIISALTVNAINASEGRDYNDIFVTAPTGSGKSVLFQIPAIYLAENNELLTLVITPLIGLMNDQVQNIQSMTDCAATINSEYTPEEKEMIKKGITDNKISILYISPETLLSNNPISNLIGDRKIGMMIIDESHIVSTWGKSFRPDYWFLGDYISVLRSKFDYRFPIATFSATVTYGGNDDMHSDIIDSLKMKTGDFEYIAPMRRDDIKFEIILKDKPEDYSKEKDEAVIETLSNLIKSGKKTIAYFPFTSHVNDFSKVIGNSSVVGRYHGGLTKIEKNTAAENFKSGQYKLILATKAFGMGIDIDDVDVVYHYAPTGNLCDYVQEIGRAARSEKIQGIAKTDFFENDYKYIKQLFGMSSIKNYQLVETLKKLRDIYRSRNTRNFIISPDEFSYIFPLSYDLQGADNSFKTAMLMIQKDFEKNPYINFKPIVFKPRSMFTKGYFLIKSKEFNILKKSKYNKYFALYATGEQMASNFIELKKYYKKDYLTQEVSTTVSEVPTKVRIHDGNIYTVDFKRMWEENYNELTFPEFKFRFFQGELEDFKISKDFLPEYLLTLSTKFGNFESIIDKFEKILKEIYAEFSKPDTTKKQFTVDELANIIQNCESSNLEHYESMIAAENFINVINNYQKTNNFATQLVFKKNKATEKYNLTSISFLKKKIDSMISYSKSRLASVLNGNKKVFLLSTKDVEKTRELHIAQLLEMFKLATYQVVSGERPEYFVRINSITQIEKIINDKNYKSEMVRLVQERHKSSIEIMNKFFKELKTDKERWDYIEQYFAGLLNQ